MHDNVIEINNLTLPYCFNNFNIKFEKNKFIIVSGPNNCGKTTLIRILDSQIKTKNQVFFGTVGIERYKITDLASKIKTIIKDEYYFSKDTVVEEIESTLNSNEYKDKKNLLSQIIKKYKLTKYQQSNPNNLNNYLKLKLSLALALLYRPVLLLLDDILLTLNKKEKEDIITIIKEYKKENSLSIIMTVSNLNDSLYGEYLYIIKNSKVVLEGKTINVLENDNIINKLGLELPFMIDLLVKLRDYDLVNNIELDMDGLVNILWK